VAGVPSVKSEGRIPEGRKKAEVLNSESSAKSSGVDVLVFAPWFSLTPGFNPVQKRCDRKNRFNGLIVWLETVKTVGVGVMAISTGLKPGVNEIARG